MSVNFGQLLVDFIGLQGTPVNIAGAVQTQIASGGVDISGYGLAGAGALQGLTSLIATASAVPESALTKALGGAAGVLALQGLTDNYKSYLNDTANGGTVSDNTIYSILGNAATLIGTGAAPYRTRWRNCLCFIGSGC